MSGQTALLPTTAYVQGAVLGATTLQALDTAQYEAINGNAGGTWSPGATIVVGGSGMWATGLWQVGSSPSVMGATGGTARLTHGTSDWVNLASGHFYSSRTLRTSLGPAADTSFWTPGQDGNGLPSIAYNSASRAAVVQGVTQGNFLGGARLAMPLRVHNGGTLTEVAVFYKIAGPRTALPANVPQMRVVQLDMLGNCTPLETAAVQASSQYQGNGWIAFNISTASPSAYYDGGVLRSAVYLCNAVINTALYAYAVQVIDESGSNALSGNVFIQALAYESGIPDIRPQ
jgi:hypothetical protein